MSRVSRCAFETLRRVRARIHAAYAGQIRAAAARKQSGWQFTGLRRAQETTGAGNGRASRHRHIKAYHRKIAGKRQRRFNDRPAAHPRTCGRAARCRSTADRYRRYHGGYSDGGHRALERKHHRGIAA